MTTRVSCGRDIGMTSWLGRQGPFVDAAPALHLPASNSRRTPVSERRPRLGGSLLRSLGSSSLTFQPSATANPARWSERHWVTHHSGVNRIRDELPPATDVRFAVVGRTSRLNPFCGFLARSFPRRYQLQSTPELGWR